MEFSTYGRHVVVDMWGVQFQLLNELDTLKKWMAQAVEKAGATIISVQEKPFEPQGVTVLFLLSESHFSIHTYPEKGFAALDCYTCGEAVDPKIAIEEMLIFLQPETHYMNEMVRGMGEIQTHSLNKK